MIDRDWYEAVAGPSLNQGDIFKECPVFGIAGLQVWPPPADSNLEVEARTLDVVVLTQCCDLENDKISDVLLAEVVAWSAAVQSEVSRGNGVVKSSKFRKLLIEGNVPGLSLLHRRDHPPELPWAVVDFRKLFTLPKSFTQQVAAAAGLRLRLLSPYREHLAQAFARFFMRVGLPHDARAFEKEGDVQG